MYTCIYIHTRRKAMRVRGRRERPPERERERGGLRVWVAPTWGQTQTQGWSRGVGREGGVARVGRKGWVEMGGSRPTREQTDTQTDNQRNPKSATPIPSAPRDSNTPLGHTPHSDMYEYLIPKFCLIQHWDQDLDVKVNRPRGSAAGHAQLNLPR